MKRLVGSAATRARIDAAHRDFVAVFAADSYAEDELSRCRFGNRRKLSRHGDWVSQREQVDADDNLQGRVRRSQRRGIDQPIHAGADVEADVIGDEYVIEPARRRSNR